MINLLPIEEKERLALDRIKKLVVILGFAILAAVISLILVLLSVKFYILGEAVSQKFILEQAKNRYQTPDFLVYNSLLQGYNKDIVQIESFNKNKVQFSSAIRNILEAKRPAGVSFLDISLAKAKNFGKIEAKLFGASDTRDNLLLFKKSLEESASIQSPNFSPESWISPKDINFYLTFEVNGN